MSERIPYYDPADGSLIDWLTPEQAADRVGVGVARAIRSKGEIKRVYRALREKHFPTVRQAISQIHSASNNTTRPRNDAGLLFAPDWVREHK